MYQNCIVGLTNIGDGIIIVHGDEVVGVFDTRWIDFDVVR